MSGLLPGWVYEFHPHDWLFLFPVAATLFFSVRSGRLSLFPRILLSAAAGTVLALVAIMIELGRPWALIGVTGTFILFLYLPVCLAVGLLLDAAGAAGWRARRPGDA